MEKSSTRLNSNSKFPLWTSELMKITMLIEIEIEIDVGWWWDTGRIVTGVR